MHLNLLPSVPTECPGIGIDKLTPLELTPGNINFKLSAAVVALGDPPLSLS